MRLLIQSAMIFFGTLMAAGLLALGEQYATSAPAANAGGERNLLLVLEGSWRDEAGEAPAGR